MTLIVTTPRGRCAERGWIVEAIFGDYLGLSYRHEVADEQGVAISMDGARLELADVLLAAGDEVWLTERALPARPLARWRVTEDLPEAIVCEPELPVLYGEAPWLEEGRLGLDVFGGAFLLLSRYEELVVAERDEHERFPARASLAAAEDFLSRPLVNEYAEVLWAVLRRRWPRLERHRREFRIAPTHDVDVPLSPTRPVWRELVSAGADVARRSDLPLALRRLRATAERPLGRFDADPANTFDLLMDLDEARGLRGAFYFIAGRSAGALDGRYSLEDRWLRRLMRRIHERGHELGLHTSYNSFRHPAQVLLERETLLRVCAEEAIEQSAWGGRGHYLRWANPDTWRGWDAAGLAYDSTLGFADSPGFRCGACFEYRTFDLVESRPLELRERPLVAMEKAAISHLRLTPERALETLAELKRRCRLFGGDFVILWHNDWVATRRQRRLYEAVLDV
jgi:peptidoglycan/xylan/chitin deacetylase (PgdA/CDA1 family)